MAATEGKAQAGRSLAKDFHQLMKNIASLSGGQARVAEWNESSLEDGITVAVVPDSGPYKDGEFMFDIFCDNYPKDPPDVCCDTKIYHPNIQILEDTDGLASVCLNTLSSDWFPSMTLEDVVQGILFLMHNPNLSDPLSTIFTGSHIDEEEFAENVRQSLDGGWVGEHCFERNRVTRGEDGEIVKDTESPEDGAAICHEEKPSETGVEEEDARPTGAAVENKTTERKKTGSGEKGAEETGVIDVG